jgi:hypothetical protein
MQSILSIWLLLLTLTMLALCSCGAQPEAAAQVGDTTITAEDVAYRQAVMAVRSDQEFPSHLALFQLIQEALMAEVGRVYDVVVSEQMLADEAARVEATSRDPETLARIRAVFGDDEAVYRRLVLQPVLVNQLLHVRFSLGHDIQAEPLARAQEVLAAALTDPTSLPALAEQFGGEYRQLEIVGGRIRHADEPFDDAPFGGVYSERSRTAQDRQGEEVPPALAQSDVEWPNYDREFVEQVVAGLAVGELHSKVVEDRHSFMVVRLLGREGDDASLESVVIPKLAFEPWFKSQSQRVPLTVNDQALKEALLAEVNVPYITDRLSAGEQ